MRFQNPASSNGFTLLELLVSLAIVGVLTAIAVPQYRAYKQRAFDLRAISDLRSVAIAEEAYYMDAEHYLSCSNEGCRALPGITRLSAGVTLEMVSRPDSFAGSATHVQGTGRIFRWDSIEGGLTE